MNIGRLNPWGSAGTIAVPKRRGQVRLGTAAVSDDWSLRFTDVLLIGILAFAYFISISVPLFGIQLNLTLLKHFPLLLLIPVMTLHLLGISFNNNGLRWTLVWAVTWPLVLLALYALLGSAVAKWALKIDDTFISFGLYLLLLPLFAVSVPGGQLRARKFAIALVAMWMLFATAAFIGEPARFGSAGLLHEIEYLVTTGFFVLYYATRSRVIKLLALILLIAAAVVNHKLTGYIISSLAVLYIIVAAGWRKLASESRPAYVVGAALFTLTTVGVMVLLYFEFRAYLPSGNVDVRTHQYQAAWREFVSSPIWGNAYMSGSGESFDAGFRTINIPTHNDVLDILKHGGLIGFVLFAWGYFAIFQTINRAISASRDDLLLSAVFIGARFFQVTALITFSLNPILLKGSFLIVIWGSLGLVLGLALRVLTQAQGDSRPAAAATPVQGLQRAPVFRGSLEGGQRP